MKLVRKPSGGSTTWRRLYIKTMTGNGGNLAKLYAIRRVERKRYAKRLADLTELQLRC